ncbi:hypothetical protein BG004_005044 [Podila humilis]|nr:hypothetical protein BG004_005044 [Podila humilis]
MFKSLFLLLSILLVSVTALQRIELQFFESANQKYEGLVYRCSQHEYQKCYHTDKGQYRGLRSAIFESFNGRNDKYSLTLYSGNNCNGNFDRWSFSLYSGKAYRIDNFPTISASVRSFKIADFHTSTTSGVQNTFEDAVQNSCKLEL